METVSLVTVSVISLALIGPAGFTAGAVGGVWGVGAGAAAGIGGIGGAGGACGAACPVQAARIVTSDSKTIVSAIFLIICGVLLLSNIFYRCFSVDLD